jgi:DNA-binding response OmpR family regulator
MATAGPALSKRCIDPLVHPVGEQERSVLAVLIANRGRVVGRRELSRRAGLAELSERRCDSVLVSIRRILGPDSLITVRSRGWMLSEEAIAAAETLTDDERQ